MELFLDTTEKGMIKLQIRDGDKILARSEKRSDRISENLLAEIEKLLRRRKIKFQDLEKISVNPGPGSFSSTRTGVATANALNFVLGASGLVEPIYDKEPNITKPKRYVSH